MMHRLIANLFWEVFLDKDNISKKSDISTLEFVKSKLLPEDQKELGSFFIEIEYEKVENKAARWVYFPEVNAALDLRGRVRRKKILKTKDQAEAKAEWDKIWKGVLKAADDSMNTPANEAEENWKSLYEYRHEEIRSVQVEVWPRKQSKQSLDEQISNEGKFKIYVFHNYDNLLPAELKQRLDEILINDEVGEWEEETMDEGKNYKK